MKNLKCPVCKSDIVVDSVFNYYYPNTPTSSWELICPKCRLIDLHFHKDLVPSIDDAIEYFNRLVTHAAKIREENE